MNGLFIPQNILELDMHWTKKAILAEIINTMDNNCVSTATNKHFANKFNLSRTAISDPLLQLEEENYIKIDNSKTVRNHGRKLRLNRDKIEVSIHSTDHYTGQSKGLIKRDDNNSIKKEYQTQSDFTLPKDTAWDKLSEEYKNALKIFIENKIIEIENVIIANGGNKKVLQYEEFVLALEAKTYKYKNFAAAWRNWNGKR